MGGGNRSMTISIISIIIIIIAGYIIISIVIVMMVCCWDRRKSVGMISGGHNLMRRTVSSAVVDVVGKDSVDIIVITMIMKVNSEGDRVVTKVGRARRKMGSERVRTISRGWNNIACRDVEVG